MDAGVPVFEVESANISLDLDTPEDIGAFYRVLTGGDMPRQMGMEEAFEVVLAALERGEFG
jgi:hypothetical protein